MTKGILRVPEGTLPELLDAVKIHFPDYVVETYASKPDYRLSYEKKVNSYYRAFEYLLNAYPRPLTEPRFSEETIKSYIVKCRAAYDGKAAKSVSDLQKELKKFTTSLIDTIRFIWNEPGDAAVELLNEAEQYVLMLDGRPDLVTLTPMHLGEAGDYVVQVDKSLPPYDEQVLDELSKIKAENYPKTPHWFQELFEPQYHFMQAYFCNLPTEPTDLINDFDDFLLCWEDIKVNAINLKSDLQQIVGAILPLPAWFLELPKHHQEMITVLANESEVEIKRRLIQFKKMLARQDFKDDLTLISKLPQWYWVLPRHQQYFLEYALKSKERVEDVVPFLCSRHRTLPMPANFAAHSLHILNKQGELQALYSEQERASHIVPRDGIHLNWPDAVMLRHALGNLTKVMARARTDQLILLQTLISPVGSEWVPFFKLSPIIPDYELYKVARTAVARHSLAPSIVQTNHPFNMAKRVLYTVAHDPDIVALLKAIELYVEAVPEVKELLENYNQVLKSGFGSTNIFDYAGRELWLSSLEQLMCLTVDGFSFGSCVSGKDRKAILSIHVDAMYIYKLIHGFWPKFVDTAHNRVNFVSIFTDLYISRHHHEHAGHNAPGSEGIKTPDKYLPTDIVLEICKRLKSTNALSHDDRLATNNEVKKVSTGTPLLPKDLLLRNFVVEELGETMCTQLYDKLFYLLSEQTLFFPKENNQSMKVLFFSRSAPALPAGIKEVDDFMKDSKTGSNSIVRMAGIMNIILTRPETDSSRTEATKSVYKLRQLLEPNLPVTQYVEMANILATEWELLFDKIKQSHRKSNELML